MLKNLLTNKCSNCTLRLMNDPLRPCRRGGSMNGDIMDGVQALPMALASSTENSREKAQKAQKQKSPFETLALFSGHSVGQARRAEAGSSPVKKVRPIRFFLAPLSLRVFAFRPHSLLLKNQGRSNPVKPGQTDSLGQAAGRNPCKALKMNNLRNKQLQSGQTMLNVVTCGQN